MQSGWTNGTKNSSSKVVFIESNASCCSNRLWDFTLCRLSTAVVRWKDDSASVFAELATHAVRRTASERVVLHQIVRRTGDFVRPQAAIRKLVWVGGVLIHDLHLGLAGAVSVCTWNLVRSQALRSLEDRKLRHAVFVNIQRRWLWTRTGSGVAASLSGLFSHREVRVSGLVDRKVDGVVLGSGI